MTEHKFINGIEYKQCSCCKEFKTLDKFQKRKSSKDGYRDKCIECLAIVKTAWLNKPVEVITHKICTKCGQDKSISEYTKDNNSTDGYAYNCKDCVKLYRQENSDRIREYNLKRSNELHIKRKIDEYKRLGFIDDSIENEIVYFNEHKEELELKEKEYYNNKKKEREQQKALEYRKQSEKIKQQKEQQRIDLYNKGLKICYVCKQTKSLGSFNNKKSSIDGLDSTCIECRNKRNAEIRLNRKVVSEGYKTCNCCGRRLPVTDFKVAMSCLDGRSGQCKNCEKEKLIVYNKSLTSEQREQRRQYQKDYTAENKEHIIAYQKQYKLANAEKIKQYDKERYRKNKLNKSMSCWLRTALKENKAERHWEDLVPYNLEQLKEHLESQFTPEMSWDNQGSYWEIDHIIPQNTFSFETENDLGFKICWSLMNLRPLEKLMNRQRPKDGSDVSEELRQQILNQFNI